MQIVIDIDEDIAQGIIDGKNDEPRNIVRAFQATIADAIKNGTPLPEHHGRLIDADWVKNILDIYVINEYNGQFIRLNDIDSVPTIIEGSDKK